jgi:hypothetical protein
MKISTFLLVVFCFCCSCFSYAQSNEKGFFRLLSPQLKDAKDYGTVTVIADKHTVVLGTVMASAENVKGLTIRINNGFAFKLAPAQNGTILNYVGSSLNIVLQPGDKAIIEFIDAGKTAGTKQLYVSGQVIEKD